MSEPSSGEQLPAELMKDKQEDMLSPGTAKILCIVINLPQQENRISVQVDSVLGYGMATKPIARGSNMEIMISNNIKKTLMEKKMKEGKQFSIIISQQTQMNSDQIIWSLVEVID